MTKAELIDEVAAAARLSKKDAEQVVALFFDSIVDALRAGDRVELRGFGSFTTRQRAARLGRNPKTGDVVPVPAKLVPHFKPGKELRALVDQ